MGGPGAGNAAASRRISGSAAEVPGTSNGWPSSVSRCVSIVTSATEAKSGARELGSTGPGSAAPERDRLGAVAAHLGGLVRVQVRVLRLHAPGPDRHELPLPSLRPDG